MFAVSMTVTALTWNRSQMSIENDLGKYLIPYVILKV